MKTMQKMLVLLLAVMLVMGTMVVPAGAASAYKAVNGADGNTLGTVDIPETLKLQWNDTPVPALTYTYALSQTPTILNKDGVTYGVAGAVGGTAPTIKVDSGTAGASAILQYTSSSSVTRSTSEYESTISNTITVDFRGTTFSEPGIYRYTITKTATGTDAATASNDDPTKYIDVYVWDTGNADMKLAVQAIVSDGEAPDPETTTPTQTANKDNKYEDQYPKARNDLTIKKEVKGAQGSKDEYFEIKVKLSNTVANTEYIVDLTYAEAAINDTIYGLGSKTNPNQIKVPAGATTVEQSFYLKHGQYIVIKNVSSGVGYETTEDASAVNAKGYTISAEVTGSDADGDTSTVATNGKVVDTSLTGAATVTYTNTKDAYVPTGVSLQIGAPIVGIVIVAGMMVIMLVSKRKKEQNAAR